MSYHWLSHYQKSFHFEPDFTYTYKQSSCKTSVSVQVMAWCWPGGKALHEPKITEIGEAIWRHKDITVWLGVIRKTTQNYIYVYRHAHIYVYTKLPWYINKNLNITGFHPWDIYPMLSSWVRQKPCIMASLGHINPSLSRSTYAVSKLERKQLLNEDYKCRLESLIHNVLFCLDKVGHAGLKPINGAAILVTIGLLDSL